MTTVDDMRGEIYEALGGRDDSVVQVAALRGLNAGVYTAYRILEPPESRVEGSLNCGSASGRIDWTSGLTRCDGRIEWVTNDDNDDAKVWLLSHHLLDVLWLPTSGSIQFYSMYGEYFYYRPIPTASETLTVGHIQYPERLDDGSDTIPYAKHEEYILSIATALTFLVLEEVESGSAWTQLADRFNIPAQLVSQIQRLMKGEVDVDYLQGILSEGAFQTGSE